MPNPKVKSGGRISKQREIEIKRRKKRKKILIVVIVLSILIAIYTYLRTSEVFNIQDIEIEGYNELTQEQICEISGLQFGQNIFKMPNVVIKVKLKNNGYIKSANVKKIYPNKIKIQIEERKRQYQILTQTGNYIYIDEQGYIIDCSQEKLDLITITGMEITEEATELKRLGKKDLNKMENILHIQDEMKKAEIQSNIQQIDTENEYILHTDDEDIIINLGDASNINEKISYVKAILKEEQGKSGTINVNGNINEGFKPYFNQK